MPCHSFWEGSFNCTVLLLLATGKGGRDAGTWKQRTVSNRNWKKSADTDTHDEVRIGPALRLLEALSVAKPQRPLRPNPRSALRNCPIATPGTMHFSFLSIIICYFMGFMCVLTRILLTIGPAGGLSSYDFANPRTAADKAKLDPARKALIGRLNGAQSNTWETIPLLVGGVIVAHMSGYPAADLDFLCQIYTALRVAFSLSSNPFAVQFTVLTLRKRRPGCVSGDLRERQHSVELHPDDLLRRQLLDDALFVLLCGHQLQGHRLDAADKMPMNFIVKSSKLAR
eukprot:2651164-Rhodomonas_salina.1